MIVELLTFIITKGQDLIACKKMNTLAKKKKKLEGFNGTEKMVVLFFNCISMSGNLMHC